MYEGQPYRYEGIVHHYKWLQDEDTGYGYGEN